MTYYCGNCRKECEGRWIDSGIGPYEFWGAKGVDTNWEFVSECCEDTIFSDEGCTVEADWPDRYDDDGRGDWDHDVEKDRRLEEKLDEERDDSQ